jgi:hypothetical protein
MRKVFNVLIASIPLLYIAAVIAMVYIMPENDALFLILGGVFLLSIVFCIGYSVNNKDSDPVTIATTNLWVIGGNLLLFAAEIIWLIMQAIDVQIQTQNGAMEGGLGIFLLIILYLPHWINYFICRLTAAVHCCRALHGICTSGQSGIYAVLHIFPVLDIISAIIVLRKVKDSHHCQQPPIET